MSWHGGPIALSRRWPAALALLLASTGCFVQVPLSGKSCGEGHDCVDGYVCVDARCVDESSAPLVDGGSRDAGGDPHDSGAPDAGHDAGTAGDGGSDGGAEDAGALDDAGEPHDTGVPEDDGGVDADASAPDDDGGPPSDDDAGPPPGDDAGVIDAGPGDGGTGLEELFGNGRDGPLEVTSSFSPNICRPLVSSDASSVTLGSATGIEAGMSLLLWQVQDTFATVGDESLVEDAELAGHIQLVRVTSRQGTRVLTDPEPDVGFASDGDRVAQACFVPEHTTVVVKAGGSLTAAPWNGSVGGVVALFASQGVTIEAGASVDASGKGFRGGLVDVGSNDVNHVTDEITDREQGGQKGEGLDPTAVGLYGRGNYANGGGGGNAHNGGGGGGGNGGAGGVGGLEWADEGDTPNPDTGGRGGAPVAVGELVTLGGGGGAAELHHEGGSDGGNGGGVVLLLTPSLAGAGDIRANGASVPSFNEAGSGGGAGGTIVMLTFVLGGFTGDIEARGGDGANAGAGLGPGGGGGGGVVRAPTTPANVDVSGGAGGLADGDARGASGGQDGVVGPLF